MVYGTSVTPAPLYTMYSNSRYIPETAWRNFCALRYHVHNHCWVSKTDTLGLPQCQNLSRERPSTLIAILVMLPLYLECLAIESSEQRKASGTLWFIVAKFWKMETGTVNFRARKLQTTPLFATTPANFLPSLEVKLYDERGKKQCCATELVLAKI